MAHCAVNQQDPERLLHRQVPVQLQNELQKKDLIMSNFKQYRRKQIAELRDYIEGEILSSNVSISRADKLAGSPKLGDKIARNPKNYNDQWLVAKKYFEDNFEPIC